MNDDRTGRFSDDEAIEETAAIWLAEREAGLNPSQTLAFEDWCRLDPRHAAAVARLERACALLEQLPLVEDRVRGGARQGESHAIPSRAAGAQPGMAARATRLFFRPAHLGLAAALALGAVAWWQWPAARSAEMRYVTAAGGYQRVVLEDGSILDLNANSKVRVRFTGRERGVSLTAGEAHFKVTSDPSRPFVVRAGDVAVSAIGTAFNVRLDAEAVEVLVTEGRVSVGPQSAEPAVATAAVAAGAARPLPLVAGGTGSEPDPRLTFLDANERAFISVRSPERSPRIERVAPAVVQEALAWQGRQIQFSDTPLREVVARFNRQNAVQLVVADAILAERPVGGVFAADNVEAFVRLLEASGDIVAERRGETEIVLRKAR